MKLFSAVCHCTRITFIMKMLSHKEENFRNIARNSLLKKRGVDTSKAANRYKNALLKHLHAFDLKQTGPN